MGAVQALQGRLQLALEEINNDGSVVVQVIFPSFIGQQFLLFLCIASKVLILCIFLLLIRTRKLFLHCLLSSFLKISELISTIQVFMQAIQQIS